MEKMKIAVTGAAGRMGRELIRAVHGNDNCAIAGGIEQEGSIALGETRDGKPMFAINVRCLDGVDVSKLSPKPFDGRSR